MAFFFFLRTVTNVSAATGINHTINFQGKIVNKADGTNIGNQSYDFTFKLYDSASGGSQLPTGTPWSETQNLPVTDGIFRATLGAVTPFPATLDFNSDSLYLDITFNGETFGSRVRLTAVPYAFMAEKVNGLTVTNTTGTLTIPNGKTIQFGDAFTTSGAFPLTLTTTASTTATLPSGTITLVDQTSTQTLSGKTIDTSAAGLIFSGGTTDVTTVSNQDFTIVPNGSGNVGIGTTLPKAFLDVAGAASISGNLTLANSYGIQSAYGPLTLNYKSGLNSWLPALTIQDSTGNVGIGTTAPAAKLEVNGAIKATQILTPYAQTIIVAKSGGDYTTITAALNSISDNGSSKRYLIMVMPGSYNERVTMKDYVDLKGSGVDVTTITQDIWAASYSTVSDLTISISGAVSWKAGYDAFSGQVANPCYIKNAKVYMNTSTGPIYPLLTKTGSYMYADNVILDVTAVPNGSDGTYLITNNAGGGEYNNIKGSLTMSAGSATYDNIGIVVSNWSGTPTITNSNFTLTNNATSNNTADSMFTPLSSNSFFIQNTNITYTGTNKSAYLVNSVSSSNVTIQDSTISMTAGASGGFLTGMSSSGPSTIEKSKITFVKNNGGTATGINTTNSSTKIADSEFYVTDNGGGGTAYGVYISGASPNLHSNIIKATGGSGASAYGTWIQTATCNPTLSNNTMDGTTTGLTVGAGCNPTVSFNRYSSLVNNGTMTGISGDTNGSLYATGNATASGNMTMGGQLQVGRFGAEPVGLGVGSMYYNTSTNKFRCFINTAWADCDTNSGGSPVWSTLQAPAADLSVAMSTYKTTFNWTTGTSTNNLFNLTTDNSSNGTGYLMNIATGTSSTVKPFHVSASGTEAIMVDAGGNVGMGTTNPQAHLSIGQANGDTKHLQDWLDSDNNIIASIDWQGLLSVGGRVNSTNSNGLQLSLGSGGDLQVVDGSSNTLFQTTHAQGNAIFNQVSTSGVALTVNGASGQTGNLQEWKVNGGSALTTINEHGFIDLTGANDAGNTWNMVLKFNNAVVGASEVAGGFGNGVVKQNSNGRTLFNYITDTAENSIFSGGINGEGVRRFALSGGGNWQLGDGSSAQDTFMQRLSGGGMQFSTTQSSAPTVTVRGASGQSANLQEWNVNGGTALALIDASGNMGIGTTGPNAFLHVYGDATSSTPRPLLKLSASDIENYATPLFKIEDLSGSGANGSLIFTAEGNLTVGGASGVIQANSYRAPTLQITTQTDTGFNALDVVVYNPTNGHYNTTTTANDIHVAGVAVQYLEAGWTGDIFHSGIVSVNVTGAVAAGDLLTTSTSAGYAMSNNSAPRGSVLGKALTSFAGPGTGTVVVMLSPGDSGLGGAVSPVWSTLQAPAADLSVAMSTYTTAFNWATGTSTNNLFNLTTDNSSNGTGYLFNAATGTSSTVKPLHISAAGTEAILVDASGNVGIGSTSPNAKLDVTGIASLSAGLTMGNGSVIKPAYGPLTLQYKSGADTWANGLTIQDSTGTVNIAKLLKGSYAAFGNINTSNGINGYSQDTYISSALSIGNIANNTYISYSTAGSAGITYISTSTVDNGGNVYIANGGTNTAGFGGIGGNVFMGNGAAANLGGESGGNGGSFTLGGGGNASNGATPGSGGNFTLGKAGTGGDANGGSLYLGQASGAGTPGNLYLYGQLQTGNFSAEPTGLGEGAMYYNTTDHKFRCFINTAWADCDTTGAGSPLWSAIQAPGTDLSVAMTTYKTTFNWATGTSTNNLFNLTTDNSANGTGYLLNLASGASSTVKPLHVAAGAVEGLMVDATGNIGIGTTNPAAKLDVLGEATVSGGLTFYGGARTIATRSMNQLTIGDAQTGPVVINNNGNFIISKGSGQNFQVNFTAAPTVSMASLSNAGQATTTSGANGLNITYSTAGSSAITNAALNIGVTNTNNTAGTVIYGEQIATISGQLNTNETALLIGSGWDKGLDVSSPVAVNSTLTATSKTVIGDTTNGFVYDPAAGPSYRGTARPYKSITLSPEYSGAAITTYYGAGTDSTNNTGSMTSDVDNSAGGRNYYSWTSTTASPLQSYTVAVRITLPPDFSDWCAAGTCTNTNALQIDYATSNNSASNNAVDVYVYNSSGTLVTSSTSQYSNNAWTTLNVSRATIGSNWNTAGGTATIYLRVRAMNNYVTKIGDIKLNYLGSY